MDIGIQVLNPVLAQLVLECSLALTSLIGAAIPSLVVQAITVNVHVVILAAVGRAVEKDSSINITAIRESVGPINTIREPAGKFVVALSGLLRVSKHNVLYPLGLPTL